MENIRFTASSASPAPGPSAVSGEGDGQAQKPVEADSQPPANTAARVGHVCIHCHRSARNHGRGLCSSCYRAHRDDYPRRTWTSDDLWEEWCFLADHLRPVIEEARRLAPALGVSVKRLQCLESERRGSRYIGGWGERVKANAA